MYQYRTKGTCSSEIDVVLEGDIVKSAKIIGGCNGNTKGLCTLVEGMKVDEVIRRLKGIRCGFKPTSCPDQLAIALLQAKEQQARK
nr:TIGR03905 family TSCPD domain-containing protein [uncultured Caproiciproducens sp.]